MTKSREVIFKVNNLKTWFPMNAGFLKQPTGHVKAVDGVSFEVYKGETLGIVGESGCGKTALGKTMMMLQEATEGEILYNYNGELKDITKFNKQEIFEFRKEIQMVFQDPYSALNPMKKIYQSLDAPLKVHGHKARQEREKIIYDVLRKVNVQPSCLQQYPHEFSGGQRQRICIAVSIKSPFLTPSTLVSMSILYFCLSTIEVHFATA